MRVRELEQIVAQKDHEIQELVATGSRRRAQAAASAKNKVKSPQRLGNGFNKLENSKPQFEYRIADPEDPIDQRLEEFYNSTGSVIPFKRINRGFYKFGETIVELDIINHKLQARTEDGWNRGKYGAIEKFMGLYETIEREKAGIHDDMM